MLTRLYFIALIPPEPVFTEVLEFKRIMASKYNASHSLKTPPHITMYKPIKLEEDREEDLAICMEDFAGTHQVVKIKLNGFSSFPPKVIFVKPEQIENLNLMFKDLIEFVKHELDIFDPSYAGRPQNPHMTIAHRDLDQNNYNEAWKVFKNKPYSREVIFDKISILKHNGNSWDVLEEFKFIK